MILLIMKLPREPDAQGDYEGLRQIPSHSFSSATILLRMQRVVCTLNDEKEGKHRKVRVAIQYGLSKHVSKTSKGTGLIH